MYKSKSSLWVSLNKGVEGPTETGLMWLIHPTKQFPALPTTFSATEM